MMNRTCVEATDAPSAAGGYAQAVAHDAPARWLHISGQIPVQPDGTVPNGFAAQAAQAWANVDAQLRAAGMARTDLQKVTIFLSDRADANENRIARNDWLAGHKVALTVIICGIFDASWLIEIEAVAAQ